MKMELKISDRLKIEYDEDLNIIEVHEYVLNLFERSKTQRLAKIDENIQKNENQSSKTKVEKEVKEEENKKWIDIRKEIEENKDSSTYEEKAKILIESYKTNDEKKKIINEYLKLLRGYINIDIVKPRDNRAETEYCVKAAKDEDADRENFKRALMSCQGKRNVKIQEDIYVKLDKYFDSYDLITRQKAKEIPLKKNGKKDGTSKELMEKALKETGNPSYYDRINIICANYWGWKLPDYTSLEAKIMEEYDATQKIFRDLPKERTSNLNLQYRLYKHLELHKEELKELGYTLRKDDFKIIGTRTIFLEYDIIWKQMTQGAGLLFISTA